MVHALNALRQKIVVAIPRSFSYIGRPMFTDAQKQYINEVLGASPASFKTQRLHESILAPFEVVVLTGPIDDAASSELLQRILASAQLSDVPRFVSDAPESFILPKGIEARHVLAFSDRRPPGRHLSDSTVWWGMSSLSAMLGEGVEVVNAKRAVWNLLQQFNKERANEK